MTKNGLDIQTISPKRTDLQTGRILNLYFQEKGQSQLHKRHIWFCPPHQAHASQNQKSRFIQRTEKHIIFENL